MTVAPIPPPGAVARPPRGLDASRGEVAVWQHTDQLPALQVTLRAAGSFGGYPEQRAHARVSTWPATVAGITDPAELRAMAWTLLAAARWLDRHSTSPGPRTPDPQTTIYDHITTEEPSP
jgi:hypothetical protein